MSLPLHTALTQCNLHAKRLAQAAADSGLPLAVAPREGEDDALIRALDQMVSRYTKLQDTMGEHVLRSFCAQVLQELVEDASMIDVLNRLEKRGYLMKADWQAQRDLRNALAHEYPDEPARQLAALNRVQKLGGQLIDWLARFASEAGVAGFVRNAP